MSIDRNQDLESRQMLGKRGEINLGDLAIALSQIRGGGATQKEMIAQCLGFRLQGSTNEPEPQYQAINAAWNRQLLNAQKPVITNKTPSYTPPLALPSAGEMVTTSSSDLLDVTLHIDSAPNHLSPSPESYLVHSDTLQLDNTTPPPPRQLLFPSKTARGLVSASVTQRVPGNNLDINKLIQSLVQQKPLKNFPVLPQLSVRNGCQLLLDFNEALMPWWDDMHSLIQQFKQVLGDSLCPVFEFNDYPLNASCWSGASAVPWQPNNQQVVIVATDLGLIQPPTGQRNRPGKADWLEFIDVCKQQNTSVIILFPLHPSRCPLGIDKLVTLIHWHPATSSAMIKRLLKRENAR